MEIWRQRIQCPSTRCVTSNYFLWSLTMHMAGVSTFSTHSTYNKQIRMIAKTIGSATLACIEVVARISIWYQKIDELLNYFVIA